MLKNENEENKKNEKEFETEIEWTIINQEEEFERSIIGLNNNVNYSLSFTYSLSLSLLLSNFLSHSFFLSLSLTFFILKGNRRNYFIRKLL